MTSALDSVMPIASKPHGCTLHRVPKDFEDLQAAIHHAAPNDCICISSGTYVLNQPLLLDKDLHLMGDDDGVAHGVVLQMDRHAPSLLRSDVHMLTLATQAARISNIVFDHADSAAGGSEAPVPPKELVFCIFAREGNIILDNCTFNSTFSSCIGCAAASRTTITKGQFVGCEYGIYCCEGSITRLRGENKISNCKTGIFFDNHSGGIVEDCIIVDCEIGIECVDNANPAITTNIIKNMSDIGIYVSSGNEIVNNSVVISDSTNEKIGGLGNTAPIPHIESNELTNNKVGVQIEHFGNPNVIKNTIRNNDTAVKVLSQGRGTITFNSITENDTSIHVLDGGAPRFTKNVIQGSKTNTVLIEGYHTYGVFKDNDISENKVDTPIISINDGCTPSILQNNIFNNSSVCISIKNCPNPNICQNEIHHNTDNGIVVESSHPEVTDNTIFNNGGRGIYLKNKSGGLYRGNNIHHNDRAGIEIDHCPDIKHFYGKVQIPGVEDGTFKPPPQTKRDPQMPLYPYIVENTICNNNGEGVTCYGGSTALVLSNNISDNTAAGVYWTNDCDVQQDQSCVATKFALSLQL